MLSRFARQAVRAKASVPRTSSAFRTFHVSAPSNNDSQEAAVADDDEDDIGNDGVLGTLFGNPFYSVPLCGLGVMTATATDVSFICIRIIFDVYESFSNIIRKQLDQEAGAEGAVQRLWNFIFF